LALMCGSSLLARHSLHTTPILGSKSFRSGLRSCLWLARLAVRCSVVWALVLAPLRVVRLALLRTRLRLLRLLKRLLARLVLARALRLVGLAPLVARLLVAPLAARLVERLIIRDRLALLPALLAVAWVAILAWAVDWMPVGGWRFYCRHRANS